MDTGQRRKSTLKNHLLAAVSLSVITLNLVFWIVPLVLVVLVRFVLPPFQTYADSLIDKIYRAAVAVDSIWLERVIGCQIRITGKPRLKSAHSIIVVSNHTSWFDILVIQRVITTDGPIIHFLIKHQLIYVPVVGWICLALNFPRLKRSGGEGDITVIHNAASKSGSVPSALLNFAEGTRFSEEKHQRSSSRYQYLLNPKTRGLGIMLDSMGDVAVLDLTLIYDEPDLNFFERLGQSTTVNVDIFATSASNISDASIWLSERWQKKDALIHHHRNGVSQPGLS